MWGTILPIALALPFTNAITLHKRDDPAVFGLPIARSERPQSLQKRSDKVVSTALYNVGNLYYMVNITVGTPAQNLSLSLDIGSSDIWVNVDNSTYCAADEDFCSSTGVFKLDDSSTFKQLDYDMNMTYAGGDYLAAGPYATDTLTIGGITVKDMEFGLAEESRNPHGILGIGYGIATYADANLNKRYSNLPEALVNSGAIKSNAYSLWLNKYDGTGNLLFGGVNKARYDGELETVPVLKNNGKYSSLAIALTDISVKGTSGTTSFATGLPLAVSLDNGSPFISLPKEVVAPIFKEVGAVYNSTLGVSYIPCDTTGSNVTFSFSGATITIPVNDLILRYYVEDSSSEDCIFGISESDPGVNLMGDSFLRGAYVVYDLDNNEISLANTNTDGGDDDILEIGTGTAAVPGATLMPSAVTSATGNGVAVAATAVASGSSEPSGTTVEVTVTGTAATETATGGASSTSSKGLAVPTAKPNHLLPGLLGAGLLLAL
ncbi:hypothetical protein N7490_009436 [Penicillium lividum]|nr:hypothetical protein N7490_009436 [Penicillium lividum]